MMRISSPRKPKQLPTVSTLEEGRLSWDGSPFPKPCLVLSFGDDRAEVRLLSEVALPSVVDLSIPGKKVTVRSKVARQQGALIELSFSNPPRSG